MLGLGLWDLLPVFGAGMLHVRAAQAEEGSNSGCLGSGTTRLTSR